MISRSLRRAGSALALLLAVLVVASACTRTVVGVASHDDGGVKQDAPPSDLKIEGGDGGPVDQLVANSMDDIMKYWEGQFESVFGSKMPPLKGGIHAYEPDQSGPIPCFSDNQKKQAANNAYYCPSDDAIAYDRAFVGKLMNEFGEFIVPLIFAHEFGHAIQGRVGVETEKSIAWEGQADCYAGVFTKQAHEGTEHFKADSQDLETVLGGYLMLRDTPGYSADDQQAHGSAFDRVGAFQEGFNEGGKHCYTSFGSDREYTAIPFTAQDKATEGNLPYDETLEVLPTEMNGYGEVLVGSDWKTVDASGFEGKSAKCDGTPNPELVFYCAKDNTVYYAEKQFVKQVYDKFGDFAAMTSIALGYADAMLDAGGSKKKGKDAFEARLCLIGSYGGGAFEATVSGVKSPLGGLQMSAGDLDEAVALLIAIGGKNEFVNTYDMDAFARIDVFRKAVLDGRQDPLKTAKACLK